MPVLTVAILPSPTPYFQDLHGSTDMSDTISNPPANSPPTSCTQHYIHWHECNHPYDVGTVVPCAQALAGQPCACASNPRRVLDRDSPGHIEGLSTRISTGLCRRCREENKREEKSHKKRKDRREKERLGGHDSRVNVKDEEGGKGKKGKKGKK